MYETSLPRQQAAADIQAHGCGRHLLASSLLLEYIRQNSSTTLQGSLARFSAIRAMQLLQRQEIHSLSAVTEIHKTKQ